MATGATKTGKEEGSEGQLSGREETEPRHGEKKQVVQVEGGAGQRHLMVSVGLLMFERCAAAFMIHDSSCILIPPSLAIAYSSLSGPRPRLQGCEIACNETIAIINRFCLLSRDSFGDLGRLDRTD